MDNNLSLIQELTINAIIEKNIHEIIAKSIVKKIAGNSRSVSMKACLDIVNSGYTQTIMDDICQDMYITLQTLTMEGKVYYDDFEGRLLFSLFTNENNDLISYYVECYHSVQHTLSSYSNSNYKTIIQSYDAILTDDNNNDFALTVNSPLYMKAVLYEGGISDLLSDDRFISIMKYIRNNLSNTRWDTTVKVVEGLLNDLTLDEIAEKYGLGIATVKRTRKTMKELYDQYGKIELTKKNNYTFGGTLKSYTRAYNGKGSSFCYTDYMQSYTPTEKTNDIIYRRYSEQLYLKKKAKNKELGRLVAECIKNPSVMQAEPSLLERWEKKVKH